MDPTLAKDELPVFGVNHAAQFREEIMLGCGTKIGWWLASTEKLIQRILNRTLSGIKLVAFVREAL